VYTYLVAAHDALTATKEKADFVCDGQDDEVEIETAIAALPDCGGRVALSEGTFTTGALLTVDRSHVTLTGYGVNATKMEIGSGLQFGLMVSGSHVGVENMWLWSVDGDRGSYTLGTHLIDCALGGLTHLSFRNLMLEHARNGLRILGNKYVTIDGVHCKNLGGQGIGSMGGAAGRPENVVVRDIIMEDVYGTGITLNPVKNAIISDVLIVNTGGNHGRIDISSNVHDTEGVTISNVLTVNAALIESAPGSLDGADKYPSGVVVTNVVVRGYHDFPAIQGSFEDLTISNFTFQSGEFQAVWIHECPGLRISNGIIDASNWVDEGAQNRCTVHLGNVPGAILSGLNITGSCNGSSSCLFFSGDDVVVRDTVLADSKHHAAYASGARARFVSCRFENNQHNGVRANADDGTITSCVFKDNSLAESGAYDDITVPGVGGWRVQGNRFYSQQVNYHYNESSDKGSGCMVTENFFDGSPVNGAVRIKKPGTRVWDNFGVPD
jgi:hypothetical protein